MDHPHDQHAAAPVMIYCTQCGGAMRAARAHVTGTVACPHCSSPVEPWRVVEDAEPTSEPTPAAAPASAPQPPPPPPTSPGVHGTQVHPGQPHPYPVQYSSRNKVVAGVLGILLGSLGIHRFYLGFIGIGLIQLILFFCTGGISGIWGFVEGILCFTGHITDIDGRPLRE